MALLHETETISFVFLLKIHCFDNWRLLFIEAENRVVHIDGIFTKLLCLVVVEIHLEAHIRAESSRISSIDSLSLIIYENVELSLFLSLSLSHSQLSLSFPVVFSIIERVIELIIRLLIEWNVALVCFIINKVTFLTLSIINHKII